MKTPVVFSSRKVRLSSEVPCLNTPGLFPFGGETRLTIFHFSLTPSSKICVVFIIVLGRMNLFNPIWERQVVFLRNDIRKKLATLFGPNHKWAVKRQSLFCFLAETPNQSQADRTDSVFENVESKSSQKRK